MTEAGEEEEYEPTTTDGGDHTGGDSTECADSTEDDGSGNPAAKKKKKPRKDRKPTVLTNTTSEITLVSERIRVATGGAWAIPISTALSPSSLVDLSSGGMASSDAVDGQGKETGGRSSSVDGVFAEKFKRMVLTEKEKKVLMMDDLEDEEGQKIAVVGKVLAPTKFHIQTITSALRPQWGNPRGLTFKAMGDNVFMANLEKEQDRKRIWEGAPWMIHHHAVVLADFETSMRPSEVRFERIPIWIQCHDLPFNWLNVKRGENIAKQIGEFIKLDMSGNSRGWGQSLRARIWLNVDEPIQRFIQINSQKRNELIPYPILYEKLPYFCFSRGKLGHSADFCLTPAERDENGDWPYDSSVRALNPRTIKREPNWPTGGTDGAGRGQPPAPPSRGPFNFQQQPGVQLGTSIFNSDQALGSVNFGNQGLMHFNAQGRGRGGHKPQVNAPKKVAGVHLESEEDKQGTKRLH
ncbi:hypothetical protein ACQ4PT_042514 [Festuca glaucescens]